MTSSALHWFVAFVKPFQERRSAEALDKMGVEHFLPVQQEKRKYSDRIKVVDVLVIPRMIFIRTTETRRRELLNDVYGIYAYMCKGTYDPVIVPDRQMEDFRFMVEKGAGKVHLSSSPFSPGDRVKVVAGPLKGWKCELVAVGEKRCVAVRLGSVGTALLDLSPADLALIEQVEQ